MTPMIWAEPTKVIDCYFCSCDIGGHNSKSSSNITYPQFSSSIRPTHFKESSTKHNTPKQNAIDANLPEHWFTIIADSDFDAFKSESELEQSDEDFVIDLKEPKQFNQQELNDLIRECGLCKEKSELLASRLKEKNLLTRGTNVTFYRKREQKFIPYFEEKDSFVYCNDINGLMKALGVKHKPAEWRLFIDSSKTSLKGILLHNGNKYASVPIAHSVHHKESHESVQLLLNLIKYNEHDWQVCGDFKILNFLLGQQSGFTKFPCFLCEWDSRDRTNHWIKKEWPARKALTVGEKNVIQKNLVDRHKVILPALHIKLGIMKQFVKKLDGTGDTFQYLQGKFPKLSDPKVKEGVFVGPQIRKLMKDDQFVAVMTPIEKNAWISFKNVIKNFLGNRKSANYKEIVDEMLKNFHKLGCNMSMKIHYLHSHLDYFPENLGAVSEEQGERMHQDMSNFEQRFQGRWDIHMMADYAWMLHRDLPNAVHTRKSKKRSLFHKRYTKE